MKRKRVDRSTQVFDELVAQGFLDRTKLYGVDGVVITEKGMLAVAILYSMLTEEARTAMPIMNFQTIKGTR